MPNRDPRLQAFARELRHAMTKEENHLWYDFLRHHQLRFLRQKVLCGYIADFYCPDAKLVIELDGAQHFGEAAFLRDEERTQALQRGGYRVIRFTNRQVNESFPDVCATIDAVLEGKIEYHR